MYDNTVAKALCKKLRSQVCTFEFLPLCLKDFHFNFSQIFISLSGGGGGGGGGGKGYMLPCSSEIDWLVPLFPQILFSYIPCSPILSRFPSKLGLSSSVPLK